MNHFLSLLIAYYLEGRKAAGRFPDVWPYPDWRDPAPTTQSESDPAIALDELRQRTLWHEHKVGEVDSAGANGTRRPDAHVCRREAVGCFGHLHDVRWKDGRDGAVALPDSQHNVIIIRVPRRTRHSP